ncbi:MAG: DUF6662 family protein [Acidobacteriota bacterium]
MTQSRSAAPRLFPNAALAACLVTSLCAVPALADESLWVYAQGTDTRPDGTWELRLANISRLDKDGQDYTFHDFRPEVEYGITDRLTLGIEAMVFHHDYSVEGEDLNPMFETQGGAGGSFNDTQLGGVEATIKYNVLSPYKDALGLSVGFSYEYRDVYRLDGAEIDQHSFVPTLYLQKNFLDDTLVFAFKGKLEFELRTSPGVEEEEIAPDLAVGVSYRVAPKWFVGFETRYQSDFLEPLEEGEPPPEDPSEFTSLGNFRVGLQYQWAYYMGPTLHYATKDWWLTLGALWQVEGGGDESNPSVRDGKVWDEHEEVHVGLTLGFEF